MADNVFEHPRLAAVYDPLDPDRSDLDVYAAMVGEFEARTVLDIGCGTGTFACMLAEKGIEVVAVDPALASLEIARAKDGAERVRWVHGELSDIGELHVDLATMTANVAQVFVTDTEWRSTLDRARALLRPGGRLVFETRDPDRQAWLRWTKQDSFMRVDIAGIGVVQSWEETTDVSNGLVSFRGYCMFESDGELIVSDSTLRFRTRDEVADSLDAAGFLLDEIRDAPDRPGAEFVFIARRPN